MTEAEGAFICVRTGLTRREIYEMIGVEIAAHKLIILEANNDYNDL